MTEFPFYGRTNTLIGFHSVGKASK